MKVIFISDSDFMNELNLDKIKKNYPDVEFSVANNLVESSKNDLIIFTKELESYAMNGKRSLFLENPIELKDNFFIVSFKDRETNIEKIRFLLDIFLD